MHDHQPHLHVTERDIDTILDRGASAQARTEVERRIAACSDCSARWARVLDTDQALRTTFPLPMDAATSTPVPARRRHGIRVLTYAAALVFAAVVGAGVHALANRAAPVASAEPTYVFLFIGSRAAEMPTAEVRAIGQDFRRWTDSLRRVGRLVAYGQLTGNSQVVRFGIGSEEAVQTLSRTEGYYVVHAPDDAAAAALARSCPYVRFQGSVVVRRRAG